MSMLMALVQHALAFLLLPAVISALLLACSRWLIHRGRHPVPFVRHYVLLVSGAACALLVGAVLLGADGKLASYGLLCATLALMEWWWLRRL